MTDVTVNNDPAGILRTPTGEIAPVPPTSQEPEKKDALPPTDPKAPEGEKKDDATLLGGKDEKKPEGPVGAPEKYEDFKTPEGLVLEPEAATKAKELFKGLNLSQEQGQQLIDFYAAEAKKAADAGVKTMMDMRKGWRDAIKADADIGGKLEEVKTTVARAIDSLGDPRLASDFRAAMDLTGAGDNPAFVKAFYKLAQRVSEGTLVRGGNPSAAGQPGGAAPKSAGHALYPNLP